jgi:hypothetical protein
MKLHKDKIWLLFLLLSLTACVSRKKYSTALSDSDRAKQEYARRLDSLTASNNTLKLRVDSLEDALAIANLPKDKTRTITSGSKRTSKLSADEEYNSKALYMYNFCKYVQWPSSFQSDNFVICVAGDSPLTDKLTAFIKGKTVNNKNIVVKKYDPKDKSLFHILFIAENKTGNFNTYRSALQSNPTLLVTDSPALASSAHISFTILDDKVKYYVNKPGAEKSGLKISQDLIKFAVE